MHPKVNTHGAEIAGNLNPGAFTRALRFCEERAYICPPYTKSGESMSGLTEFLVFYEDGHFEFLSQGCHGNINILTKGNDIFSFDYPQGSLVGLAQPFRYYHSPALMETPLVDLSPFYRFITNHKISPWKDLFTSYQANVHYTEFRQFGTHPSGVIFPHLNINKLLVSNFLIASRKMNNQTLRWKIFEEGIKYLPPAVALYMSAFFQIYGEDKIFQDGMVGGKTWFFECERGNRTSGQADVIRLFNSKPQYDPKANFFNERGGEIDCNQIWNITYKKPTFITFLRDQIKDLLKDRLRLPYYDKKDFWPAVVTLWKEYNNKYGQAPEDIK